MRMMSSRQAAAIGLLASIIMMGIGPVAAMQTSTSPRPAQTAEPFVEMLPGVYVHWQWWNESSEGVGAVPLDIRSDSSYQFMYYVEDIFDNGYKILENMEYNSTNVWSFSNLFVTIILDPDGTFISWLSTQPTQDSLWAVYWAPNSDALSGDEVFVYSSFYYSNYNYSYSYKADYTWMDQTDTPVNPSLVVPILKDEYQWASSMSVTQNVAETWHYCGFGYDVSEMTVMGNLTQWMQHYFAGFSIFNDTDHDGTMDIAYNNITPGAGSINIDSPPYYVMNQTKSELKYSFYAENATMGRVRTPFVNEDRQIEWGAEVMDIAGVLTSSFPQAIDLVNYSQKEIAPTPEPISTRVDSLKMTYRFEVTDKSAVLKIDQYTGDFENPATGGILSEAEGLSLALNYWSSFSSSTLVPLVGNDTAVTTLTTLIPTITTLTTLIPTVTTPTTLIPTLTTLTTLIPSPEAEPIPSAGLLFTEEGKPLVVIEFGGTYIWGFDNSTHEVGTSVMPMYLYASPLLAAPSLTNIASEAPSMLPSSFYYSSCYGKWDGHSILHDPVFVAYPGVPPGDISGRISGILYTTALLGGIAVVVFAAVCIRIKRVRGS